MRQLVTTPIYGEKQAIR